MNRRPEARANRRFAPAHVDRLEPRLVMSVSIARSAPTIQRDIVYRSVPGDVQRLDVLAPSGAAPIGGRPVVLAIHGGGWRRYGKTQYEAVVAPLLREGFVVVAPNYRLSGPGRPSFPIVLDELRDAVRWVRAHAEVFGGDPRPRGRDGGIRRRAPRRAPGDGRRTGRCAGRGRGGLLRADRPGPARRFQPQRRRADPPVPRRQDCASSRSLRRRFAHQPSEPRRSPVPHRPGHGRRPRPALAIEVAGGKAGERGRPESPGPGSGCRARVRPSRGGAGTWARVVAGFLRQSLR